MRRFGNRRCSRVLGIVPAFLMNWITVKTGPIAILPGGGERRAVDVRLTACLAPALDCGSLLPLSGQPACWRVRAGELFPLKPLRRSGSRLVDRPRQSGPRQQAACLKRQQASAVQGPLAFVLFLLGTGISTVLP